MSIVQSLMYTIQLLKKSFLVCLQKPILFIFPCLSFLIFCLIEVIVWGIVYLRYGIHFFNADSLELWGLVSLWELSFFILFLLAPLYFLIMINMLVMQVSTAHNLLFTSSKSPTAFESIFYSIKKLKIIVEYAWAKTIVIVDGETAIKKFFKKQGQKFGIADFLIQAKSDMWDEVTILMVPLIAIENCSLKGMLKTSEGHMQETFGSGMYATFAFNELFLLVTVFLCYGIEKIVSYIWNEAVGVAVIFFILGLVLTIVLMAEGIFFSVIYNYCLKKPIAVFSKDDIEKAFEKAE